MNTLLYLHKDIKQESRINELLNIISSWKNATKGKNIIVTSLQENQHIIDNFKNWDIDKIIFLKNDSETYTLKNLSSIIKEIISNENIDCISMGNSLFEKELAPYLASSYDWDYIPNIIEYEFNDNNIHCKKFLYGTKAIEEIISERKNIIISISPNIYKKDEKLDAKKDIEIMSIDVKNDDDTSFEIIKKKKKVLQTNPLETAKIVVGVGKGIQGKENFEMINTLSNLLGATIGVTRSVVDNGWRPEYEKIGQTGKIIKPELYLGFGISGAMQHMVGVQQARHVIMINNNPNAECFNKSDLGIVSDLFKVIPNLISLINN